MPKRIDVAFCVAPDSGDRLIRIPEAAWPYFQSAMRRGASMSDATVEFREYGIDTDDETDLPAG